MFNNWDGDWSDTEYFGPAPPAGNVLGPNDWLGDWTFPEWTSFAGLPDAEDVPYVSFDIDIGIDLGKQKPTTSVPFAQVGTTFTDTSTDVSDLKNFFIPIKLNRALTQSLRVDITIGGSVAWYDTPDYGDESVVGPAYTISDRFVIFGPGESEKMVSISILERKDPDGNHVPFFQETIIPMLSIYPPDGGKAIAVNTNPAITVVDDVVAAVINVVTDHGAAADPGDDSTDATVAFQAAIDAAAYAAGGTGQAVVYIPDGTYRLGSPTNNAYALNLKPCVSFVGQSKDGVILKRHNKAWFLSHGYTWITGFRYIRLFQSQSAWSNDVDSPLAVFRNVTLDGNADSFYDTRYAPYFTGHSYSDMEGANAVFAWADPAKAGRVRMLFENCYLSNHPCGALSWSINTDIQTYNCMAYNCMGQKNSYIIVGGYSKHRLQWYYTSGDNVNFHSGFDTEINTTTGYGGVHDIEFMATDCEISGGFELTGAENSSSMLTYTLTRFKQTGTSPYKYNFFVIYRNLHFSAYDCDFLMGSSDNKIEKALSAYFENCRFVATAIPSVTGDLSAMFVQYLGSEGTTPSLIHFKGCSFTKDSTLAASTVYGIETDMRNYEAGVFEPTLKIENCSFSGISSGVYCKVPGGRFQIIDCTFDNLALYCWGTETSNLAHRFTVWELSNMPATNFGTGLHKYAYISSQAVPQLSVSHVDVIVPEAINFIDSVSSGLSTVTIPNAYPGRLINGSTNPTTSHPNAFVNDEWAYGGHTYKCTVAGWNATGHNSTWVQQT